MSLDYAWGRFYDAVRFMVSSNQSLRDRLHGAYTSLHPLKTHRIPDEPLARRFDEIDRKLMSKGSLRETLDAMDDDQAREIAEEIFDLFHDLNWPPRQRASSE